MADEVLRLGGWNAWGRSVAPGTPSPVWVAMSFLVVAEQVVDLAESVALGSGSWTRSANP